MVGLNTRQLVHVAIIDIAARIGAILVDIRSSLCVPLVVQSRDIHIRPIFGREGSIALVLV